MSSPANRHRPCRGTSPSLALPFLLPFQLLYRSVAAYGRELLKRELLPEDRAMKVLFFKILLHACAVFVKFASRL